MSREYKCVRITYGSFNVSGTQALCKMSEEVHDHATAATGPVVPQGHRLLTSPVVKVQVTPEEIAIFTMSGSKYWMKNESHESPCSFIDVVSIKKWLVGRGPDPDPWPLSDNK